MAMNYEYNYAEIDPATNMCIGVYSGTAISTNPTWVAISVNDPEYICKFYNWGNGKFYYDPEYTQEYISPLM